MINGNSELPPSPPLRDLITKHSRGIRAIIRNRCGDAVLARTTVDDVYQDTIEAAMASAHTFRYEDDSRFFAWIAIVARRVISRKLNRSPERLMTVPIRRSASTGNGIRESQLFSPRRSPSSSAAAHESTSALRSAIDKLPQHYKKAMILYKMEERPLAEVAQSLGRTKGATCRLLARATSMLRKELERR